MVKTCSCPFDGLFCSAMLTLFPCGLLFAADETLSMPFYKLSTEPGDKASVKIEQAGHYCLSFIESSDVKPELLPIIFDSPKIFGMDTSLETPAAWSISSIEEILAQPQYGWAKTSSAFAAVTKIMLKPGENVTIASVYGKADQIERLPEIASLVTAPNFIETKFQRARSLINDLTAGVDTETVNPLFDGTVRQM
jgi:hypothetical protein